MSTMYDRLPNATPDYAQYFDVNTQERSPQNILPIRVEKRVDIHEGLGVDEERILRSDQSKPRIVLQWTNISQATREYIADFYDDPSKACGTYQSFYYTLSTGIESVSHDYVCRFDGQLEISYQNYERNSISSLILIVLGRKAP